MPSPHAHVKPVRLAEVFPLGQFLAWAGAIWSMKKWVWEPDASSSHSVPICKLLHSFPCPHFCSKVESCLAHAKLWSCFEYPPPAKEVERRRWIDWETKSLLPISVLRWLGGLSLGLYEGLRRLQREVFLEIGTCDRFLSADTRSYNCELFF